MNLVELADYFYRMLIRLYPAAIRREFGNEMAQVFSQAARAVAGNSNRSLVLFVLREVGALVMDLARAHWAGWISLRETGAWNVPPLFDDRNQYWLERSSAMAQEEVLITEGGEPWRMALPPLLIGLGIASGALVRTDVWHQLPGWQLYLSAALPLAAGAVVVGLALMALVRGLPAWGVSWLGSAFMGTALATQVILDELITEGVLVLRPWLQYGLTFVILAVGLLLLFLATRGGWQLAGLFTLAAAATLGLSLLQSVTAAPMSRDDLALLAAPLGLLMAGLLYSYILASDGWRLAIIATMGLVNAGVVLLANQVWLNWLGERAAASPAVPLLVIATVLLLSGPIAGILLGRAQPA